MFEGVALRTLRVIERVALGTLRQCKSCISVELHHTARAAVALTQESLRDAYTSTVHLTVRGQLAEDPPATGEARHARGLEERL